MSTARATCTLPSAMEMKLRSIRRRRIALIAVRAVTVGLAALLLAMVAAMIIDWWYVLFNVGIRTALTAASLLTAVAAMGWVTLPHIREARGWTGAAAGADQEVPQLEERWTTVASFAESGRQPSSATGRGMLQQVTSEATTLERLVQPRQVASVAGLRPAATWLAGALLLLAAFLALNWPLTSVLMQRFWQPTTPITATQLTSLSGDMVVPKGEMLSLETQLTGVPRHAATLVLKHDSGIIDEFQLVPDPQRPKAFVHSLRADSSFQYRTRSGDGQTAWNSVQVVDYPEFAEVQFRVDAPEYVERPPIDKSRIPSRLKVVQGSRLRVLMKPSMPLVTLALEVQLGDEGEERSQTLTLTPNAKGWYEFETQLLRDFTFRPTLLNAHGLENQNPERCRIQVIPDKAPVARVIRPTDEMAVAPDEVLEVEFEAHDDHGVASAELVIYDESERVAGEEPEILKVQPIPLGDQSLERYVRATTTLDLAQLDLPQGAAVSYAIRVKDNRNVQFDAKALRVGSAVEEVADAKNPGEEPQVASSSDPESAESPSESQLAEGDPAPEGPSPEAETLADTEPTSSDAENEDADPSASSVAEAEPAADPAAAEDAPPQPADLAVEDASTDDDMPPAAESNPSDLATAEKPDEGPEPVADRQQPSSPPQDDGSSAELASADSNPEQSAAEASSSSSTEDSPGPPVTDLAEIPPQPTGLTPQQSQEGQDTETSRRKLTITDRLVAVATADTTPSRGEQMQIRENVVEIDRMLERAEAGLLRLVERQVADSERGKQFQILDTGLGEIETYIAELRNTTKDHEHAFVGLQMVEIGRVHVTPARDHVFAALPNPNGDDTHPSEALRHVVRARELLAALLAQYDEVVRDVQLAEQLDETVEMYEVYVEKMQQLMRERRQAVNPLDRKMAVVEVNQNYLDRYAEVLRLRREMMSEFARMLGSDPRLLGRYLDLVKRRRNSFRDQLAELAGSQDELLTEVSGWLAVSETQRDALWSLVADLRMHTATSLAQDSAEFTERVVNQLPLVLDPEDPTPRLILGHAANIASLSRALDINGRQLGTAPLRVDDAARLVHEFSELDAALDRLGFEHESVDDVVVYVNSRLVESRTVADQAEAWYRIARATAARHYHELASLDQRKLAVATELLRAGMSDLQSDLIQQFDAQGGLSVPAEILRMATELQQLLENITFNQAAAVFAFSQDKVDAGYTQQAKAMEGFERAEELFDEIRRGVIAALDEYDVPDPNIADLVDPTLDAFLAQFERELDLEAQLGIPNRPRNLRVMADSLAFDQDGGELLDGSSDAAMQRVRDAIKRSRDPNIDPEQPQVAEDTTTADERTEELRTMLEQSVAQMQADAEDPEKSEAERRKMQQMAAAMRQLLEQVEQPSPTSRQWDELAKSDEVKSMLEALARGEVIPDQQWNKLVSSLQDGLWQVGGKEPPAEYRRAIEQYQNRIRLLTDGVTDEG